MRLKSLLASATSPMLPKLSCVRYFLVIIFDTFCYEKADLKGCLYIFDKLQVVSLQ